MTRRFIVSAAVALAIVATAAVADPKNNYIGFGGANAVRQNDFKTGPSTKAVQGISNALDKVVGKNPTVNTGGYQLEIKPPTRN